MYCKYFGLKSYTVLCLGYQIIPRRNNPALCWPNFSLEQHLKHDQLPSFNAFLCPKLLVQLLNGQSARIVIPCSQRHICSSLWQQIHARICTSVLCAPSNPPMHFRQLWPSEFRSIAEQQRPHYEKFPRISCAAAGKCVNSRAHMNKGRLCLSAKEHSLKTLKEPKEMRLWSTARPVADCAAGRAPSIFTAVR